MKHRLRKLQRWYRERFELKKFAATFIKKKWKVFKLAKESRALRREAISYMKRKAATTKIAKFSKTIKARKVTAKAMLLIDQIVQRVDELSKQDGFDCKVLKIQKAWRSHQARKLVLGLRIQRDYRLKQQLWDRVLNRRYQDSLNVESEYLGFCAFHAREVKNVDGYFSK